MSNTAKCLLPHARIRPHRSAARGHSDHGWLDSYHSFSFADWHHPAYQSFGALRVLNEDRVQPQTGFPTHPHRDFEIFSYVVAGELTHRDSMLRKGAEGGLSDKFCRMRRGDVQFTTGGRGVAHSEFNEHADEPVHFLQIWATPWKRGLEPRYHTRHFDDDAKRRGFVRILSPLKGGADATDDEERAAQPVVAGTIPIHADFVMGAGLVGAGKAFSWAVGGGRAPADDDDDHGSDGNASTSATEAEERKVFVHLAMTHGGRARIRLDGRDDAVLEEGDGAFVEGVGRGDVLTVEGVGDEEAEVVVLDAAS